MPFCRNLLRSEEMAKRPTKHRVESQGKPVLLREIDARTRRAMNRKENARDEWWMYRCDGWAVGVWEFTLDPRSVQADWKVKIGSNKRHVERRVTVAKRDAESRGNLMAIRRMVDMMRERGGR